MNPWLIIALLVSGTIGWFVPLSYILGVGMIFAILFSNADEIARFFIAAIGGVLIFGALMGYGIHYYNDNSESLNKPINKIRAKSKIVDGKEYILKYVPVEEVKEAEKVEEKQEKSFWLTVKTYKPFGIN